MAGSSASMPKGSFQPDTDVHITFEDQQKINKFARQNARLEDVKDELKSKQKEMQNIEDAADELMMLEEEATIPYMLGEVFVSHTMKETEVMIEERKKQLKVEIDNMVAQCDVIKMVMTDLKVQLYAKFGNNINLEADED